MLKQTDDKLTLKIVVITSISKQDKLATNLKNKDMTKLISYCLFPLNKTIIKEPFTSIGMIDIYKVDTFATNPQQT